MHTSLFILFVLCSTVFILAESEENDKLNSETNIIGTAEEGLGQKESGTFKDWFGIGRNLSVTDNRMDPTWHDEVGNWEAPYEFRKNFPYYLSGFTKDNLPIWISEWGKFDMRRIFRGDPTEVKKNQELFKKYTRQAAYLAVLSQEIRSTPEKPVRQHTFIIDFDGLTLQQLGSRHIVNFCLELATTYRWFFERNIGKFILINVNSVAEILINLARHLFGRILGRIESYGTSKDQWLPALHRNFPKDQLPEWYGGTNKNHKPIVILG